MVGFRGSWLERLVRLIASSFSIDGLHIELEGYALFLIPSNSGFDSVLLYIEPNAMSYSF